MDIQEALSIIPRSLISIVTLFVATKILGKKQISELSLFDYCIGISIGNFTAEMILVLENQIINGVIAILTFGIVGYLISLLSMKSIYLRKLFMGVPTTIMSDGKIYYESLKKLNIDINDFLEQTRNAGYFDIEEISCAIMEANGKISFLPKDEYKNVTKKDLKLKQYTAAITANIIIDSKIMEETIKNTDRSYEWFKKELKIKGYDTYENILLATYKDNSLKIYRKNENVTPKNLLE